MYFAEVITLLVVETNSCYHDYIDRLDNGPSPEPSVTEADIFVFNNNGTWCNRQTDKTTGLWWTRYTHVSTAL
jgi:hypothetical protein